MLQKFWYMDDRTCKYLYDILTAISEIELFLGSEPRLFETFHQDLRLRRAVERDIEIIGEAMNRVLKTDSSIVISHYRLTKDCRCQKLHHPWIR